VSGEARCLIHSVTSESRHDNSKWQVANGDRKPRFWKLELPLSRFGGRVLKRHLNEAARAADATRARRVRSGA
jgi:hypothetical protein